MAYRIRSKDVSVEQAIRRIASEQIDRAIASIDEGPRARAVHDVRKRCKKLRALARLVRPALSGYAEINAAFREVASGLSQARDAKVLQDTYDLLMEHYGKQVDRRALGSIRRRFTISKKQEAEDGAMHEGLALARDRLVVARRKSSCWSLEGSGDEAVIGGLTKTYRRARGAAQAAKESPGRAAFHEMRKRLKYHWHHCRLLQGAWPEIMEIRQDAAKRLSDVLGHHHDLEVFACTLSQDTQSYGTAADVDVAIGLARRYQKRLERDVWPVADRLLAQQPGALGNHMGLLWNVWREE